MCRFDFNEKGKIVKEDVRLLMSYVPFIDEDDIQQSDTSPMSPNKKTMRARTEEQTLIRDFIEKVFGQRISLSLAEYKEINNHVSSEMFYSIMRVLHNRIPCTKNFFRQKWRFRQNEGSGSTTPV